MGIWSSVGLADSVICEAQTVQLLQHQSLSNRNSITTSELTAVCVCICSPHVDLVVLPLTQNPAPPNQQHSEQADGVHKSRFCSIQTHLRPGLVDVSWSIIRCRYTNLSILHCTLDKSIDIMCIVVPLTFPTPPACGAVNETNRKNGLSNCEELVKNSIVVLTNTSAATEQVNILHTSQYERVVAHLQPMCSGLREVVHNSLPMHSCSLETAPDPAITGHTVYRVEHHSLTLFL